MFLANNRILPSFSESMVIAEDVDLRTLVLGGELAGGDY